MQPNKIEHDKKITFDGILIILSDTVYFGTSATYTSDTYINEEHGNIISFLF